MKKIHLNILVSLISFVVTAQEKACPDICSQDLSKPVYTTVFTSSPISYAKNGETPGYHDVSYHEDADQLLSFCFKHATKCITEKDALVYKVFYPDFKDYKTCPLPCIILAHGGFFSDCSEYSLVFGFCQDLAKRGFVVYSLEYRRGSIIPPNDAYMSVQQMLAMYRASQDIRGAIRSIIKRAANEKKFNDPWRIDTNSIFLAGESAGAVAMLNATYYTPKMIYQLFPKVEGSVSITNALGPLDADFYYSDPTIDYLSHIKGICSQSSGLFIPYTFNSNPKNFFPANTPKIPLILFHGNRDSIFNVNHQRVYLAPKTKTTGAQTNYNTETFCLNAAPFKADPDADTPDLLIAGALGINDFILKPLHINSEIYIDCQMSHNIDDNGPAFNSDFGTGLTTHGAVVDYEAGRTATFFQAVMSGIAGKLHKNIFKECENLRVKCNTADNFSAECCTGCNANDGSKCDTIKTSRPTLISLNKMQSF